MTLALVHTCVRSRDIDASVRFYEALGFERRGKLDFGQAYNIYMGLPGDGDRLELTVNVGREEPYDLGDGYNHIALTVEDLDGLLGALAELGIEPEKPPYAPGGREEVGRICFVADPDGYRVELIDGAIVPDAPGPVGRGPSPAASLDPGHGRLLRRSPDSAAPAAIRGQWDALRAGFDEDALAARVAELEQAMGAPGLLGRPAGRRAGQRRARARDAAPRALAFAAPPTSTTSTRWPRWPRRTTPSPPRSTSRWRPSRSRWPSSRRSGCSPGATTPATRSSRSTPARAAPTPRTGPRWCCG